MSETLTQDRLQDNLWYDAFPGQFPAVYQDQVACHFPQYLESFAAQAPVTAAVETAESAPTATSRSLGYMPLSGAESGVQYAGGFAEDIAAIALGGAQIPRSELRLHPDDYALAA